MVNLDNLVNKLKLNKKGQAFSTFQLLIAAVVALALLGVLLPIILNVIPMGSEPQEVADRLIKTQITSYGSLNYTDDTTFKTGKSISAASLANAAQLARDRICVIAPDDDDRFTAQGNGFSITYNSSSSLKYRIGILCDNYEYLGDDDHIEEVYPDIPDSRDDCFTDDIESYEKVCIVFPKRA